MLGVGVREQPADVPAQQRGISSGQHVDAKPDVTRIRAAEQPLDGRARGRISHEQGRGIPVAPRKRIAQPPSVLAVTQRGDRQPQHAENRRRNGEPYDAEPERAEDQDQTTDCGNCRRFPRRLDRRLRREAFGRGERLVRGDDRRAGGAIRERDVRHLGAAHQHKERGRRRPRHCAGHNTGRRHGKHRDRVGHEPEADAEPAEQTAGQ